MRKLMVWNVGSSDLMTHNKIYSVEDKNTDFFSFLNDLGDQDSALKSLFMEPSILSINTKLVEEFHLLYIENGRIKLRSFISKETRNQFVGKFLLNNLDNKDDNEVMMCFEGNVEKISSNVVERLE